MSEDTGRIHRHNYESSFTIMPHHIVEHENLSWVAKSILWYLLSRPLDWKVYRAQLAKVYKGSKRGNGKDAVDTAFEELIEQRYIIYTANDESTGKFTHRYDVYPEQQPEVDDIKEKIPKPVKPATVPARNGLNHPQPSTDSIPKNEKDNVLTVPSCSEGEKKEPAKDRFVKNLSPMQKDYHDRLIKLSQATPQPLESDHVCAWFLSKKYSLHQIDQAHEVYQQDAKAAKERGGEVVSMGGTMIAAIKSGRKPKSDDLEFNRAHAQMLATKYPWIEVLKAYVKVRAGNVQDEVELNQNKNQFINQLDSLIETAQVYA